MKAALLLAAGIATQALAQEAAPPVVRLALDEAVARALAASPRLAGLVALETAASESARGARAERWPQVDLAASYQRHSEVPELAIFAPTGDPARPVERVVIYPNIQDRWTARAGLSQPLFTGGRVSAGIDAAEQGHIAAGQDLVAARADLVLETKTAYWRLVTAREGLRVLQEEIVSFEAHLQDARNRESFGLAARNEVLAIEVERDRVELERLRADAESQLAEVNLQRLLGLAPQTAVETTEALAAAPVPRAELEALVAQAMAARPERRALDARVAASLASARVEHGSRLPELAATADYLYANPNREIVPPTATWKDTWEVGVGLSWRVFDGARRSSAQARAEAQAEAVRQQLVELDRGIRLEVSQRALELRTAEAALVVAERRVVSAAESRRVAAERHREGVIPSSERLDAEVAHEHAALARTEALAALRLAAAGLDRAVGR